MALETRPAPGAPGADNERGLPGWAPAPPSPGWAAPPPPGNSPGAPTPHPYAPYPGAKPQKRFGWGAVIGSGIGGIVLGALAIVVLGVLAFAVGDDGFGGELVVGTHGTVEAEAPVANVGSCLADGPESAVIATETNVVPCTQPHGSEILGIVDAPAASVRPTEVDFEYFADGACGIAFADYVGTTYDESDLYYQAVVPDGPAWRAKDQRVWCLLDSSGYQDSSGSARDSGA